MALPTTLNPSGKVNSTGAGVSPAEPTGVADGDLEILVASTIAGATISITANGGSAWTALGTGHQDVTSGEHLYVWYRIRQAGDSAPTVTPSADHICATMYGYHAVDGTTPVEAIAWSSETTSDQSYSFAPGNSTTVNDCIVCTIYSSGTDSNTGQGGTVFANASLTNVALLAEYQTTSGGGGGFVILEGDRVTAGTTGTWSDTMVTATPKAYVSFAVRPLAGTAYTESATVAGVTSVSAVEIYAHDYVEAATLVGATALSAVETADYIGAATISGVTSLSVVETSDFVGAATISIVTTIESVDVADYVDAATVDGTTSITTNEVYTPAAVTQKGYPISDITSSGWSASTGTDLFACIDDPDSPNDGDYIYAVAT